MLAGSVSLLVEQDSGQTAPEVTLDPGHSAQLHTAIINRSSLALRLLDYLSQDWTASYGSVSILLLHLCLSTSQ